MFFERSRSLRPARASEHGVRPQMKRDIMHLATEGNRRVHRQANPARANPGSDSASGGRPAARTDFRKRPGSPWVCHRVFVLLRVVGFGIWKVTDQIEFGTGALTTEAEVDSSKPSSSTLGARWGRKPPSSTAQTSIRRWSSGAGGGGPRRQKGTGSGSCTTRYAAPPEFKGRTKGPLVFRTEDGKLRSIDLSAMDSYHLVQGPTEGVELDKFLGQIPHPARGPPTGRGAVAGLDRPTHGDRLPCLLGSDG